VSTETRPTATNEHPHWCPGDDEWECWDGSTTDRHHTLDSDWFQLEKYEAVEFEADGVRRTTTDTSVSCCHDEYAVEEIPEMIRRLQALYDLVTTQR